MAARGRPKAELVLSDVERETLTRWSRRPKTSQALALRARIVLACADGSDNKEVAAQWGIWPQTVGKWRARFVRDRLDGLSDEPRPGAPRKITDEQVEAVIVKTLEEAPVSGDTPMVDPVHGSRDRNVSDSHQPDLAHVRAQAAHGRVMEAVD